VGPRPEKGKEGKGEDWRKGGKGGKDIERNGGREREGSKWAGRERDRGRDVAAPIF